MRFLPEYSANKLFCFSPPVMLVTLILEFAFAAYLLIASKLRRASSVIIILLLICLATFQLAEYQVCAGDKTLAWMRLGYVAITLLPALGIHLISLVTGHKIIRNLGYILSIGFIWIFLFSPESIHAVACGGNYILINTTGIVATTYFPAFYYMSLAIGIAEILSYDRKSNPEARNMLYWLLGGYATFIIPTAAVYLLSTASRSGIPSIMCGFAVFLSVILTLFVYPRCIKLSI